MKYFLLFWCVCSYFCAFAQSSHQYEQQADSALGMRNYALAISLYQNALQLSPQNPDLKAKQGIAYLENGDFATSDRLFEEASKINPQNTQYLTYRLDALTRAGKVKEARQMLDFIQKQKGMQAIANDGVMLHTVGNLFLAEGNFQEAMLYQQRAISKAPNVSDFHLSLSTAQAKLKQYREAYLSAHKALDLGDEKALELLLELYPNLPAGITAEQSEEVIRNYYAHDLAHLLKGGERAELNKKLQNIHQKEGIQIGIAVIPSLGGKEIEDLSEQISKVWNLNYQSKKGLLILVAVNDHQMHLHVLSEMRELISDELAIQLLETHLKPHFKTNDYGNGFLQITQELTNIINGKQPDLPAQSAETGSESWEYHVLIWGLIICAFILIWYEVSVLWAVALAVGLGATDMILFKIPFFWLVSLVCYSLLTIVAILIKQKSYTRTNPNRWENTHSATHEETNISTGYTTYPSASYEETDYNSSDDSSYSSYSNDSSSYSSDSSDDSSSYSSDSSSYSSDSSSSSSDSSGYSSDSSSSSSDSSGGGTTDW